MLAVSHLEVSRPRVSRPWLPNGFSNQDFGRTFTLIFFIFPLNFNSTSTLNLFHSFSNFDSTFTLLFLNFPNSNNTSIKWISKLRNWEFEISNLDAGLWVCVRLRASRRSAIYRRHSSRPASQVVGLASPPWWPTGLLFHLIFLCFTLKQEWMAVGGNSVEKWPEWRWR